MMSVKTQTVLPHAINTLKGGEKVLFRILNTNQASQDRAVAAETSAGKDVEDFQINIAETLVNFIENSFPTEVLPYYGRCVRQLRRLAVIRRLRVVR